MMRQQNLSTSTGFLALLDDCFDGLLLFLLYLEAVFAKANMYKWILEFSQKLINPCEFFFGLNT